jgi:putative ATP-dependent endonuclease of the OLD family
MKLESARIDGYRCFDSETVSFEDLTILLGSNSAGKSAILKALKFVFDGDAVTADDVFADGREQRMSVRLTFSELSPGDREVLGPYGGGEQLVLTQTWSDGGLALTGRALKNPLFDAVRAHENGNDRKAEYKRLRLDAPDLGLPDTNRVADADDALLAWEMDHPEQCETREEDASRFFGFAGVGRGVLARRFKFVFVPGLRDATQEAVEGKGTLLQQLLSAIAEQRSEADAQLQELEERTRIDYAELVERVHGPTLEGLAAALRDQMRRYVPTADVQLDAVETQLRIGPPTVRLRGGEQRHLTDLGRQGHGFQRTFVIAALEYLAYVSTTDDGGDRDRPALFLAIEEPELYQHPPRARHFANTLRALAASDGGVQVCFATHSPYFVDAVEFASVRVCRRVSRDPAKPLIGTVSKVDLRELARQLQDLYSGNMREYLARTLHPRFREAFFANAVLLVEGTTDAAVFEQVARMLGHDLLARGVVCADVSKTVIPLALAILRGLRIPAFVVFDGDAHTRDQDVCDACGRGDKNRRSEAARRNREILRALGEPPVDFPGTCRKPAWAAFETDLERYLATDVPGFEEKSREVANEMSWKRKSAEVHVETLVRLGPDAVPGVLRDVVERALALAGTDAQSS